MPRFLALLRMSPRPVRSTAFLLPFALLVAVLATGCGRRETNVERGLREQILHRGIGPEVADLDPHLATGTTDYTVLSALFEGLVAEDPVDLSPVPGAAERWEVSTDGLVYTFFLRRDARWSDGQPVTAQDFLDSWRRVLTKSLAADNAVMLYVVAGAEAYHKGANTDFGSVGFAAPDAHTVRITLEHPTPHFLSMLQHWTWWPVPLRVLQQQGAVHERGNPWARPGSLVGNGPFVLKEWKVGQRMIVLKSPTYWDAAKVRLNGIHFYPIEDLSAEERAFRSGQLHVTEALPPSKIDTYRQNDPHLLRVDPYLGTYFYRINVTLPFFSDVRVRRALSLSIDRAQITERILRQAQSPAFSLTPPGIEGYPPPAGLGYDVQRARQLLTEAGFPEGKGAPSIELLFNTSETHREIAEALQEMWRKHLGLQIVLRNMENKSVLAARRTLSYQLLRSNWIGDFADPTTFLKVFRSDSGNNHTGWNNATYDRLLFTAALTSVPAERTRLLRQAEELLLQDAPIIPVYHFSHVFLLHPSVRGWNSTLLDHHPYKHVWLEAP